MKEKKEEKKIGVVFTDILDSALMGQTFKW